MHWESPHCLMPCPYKRLRTMPIPSICKCTPITFSFPYYISTRQIMDVDYYRFLFSNRGSHHGRDSSVPLPHTPITSDVEHGHNTHAPFYLWFFLVYRRLRDMLVENEEVISFVPGCKFEMLLNGRRQRLPVLFLWGGVYLILLTAHLYYLFLIDCSIRSCSRSKGWSERFGTNSCPRQGECRGESSSAIL